MSEMMTVEKMDKREVRIREILNERYPCSPLLIPIGDVADIVGISKRTIYGQVKKNTFFVPHRMINRTAMVDLDDFVRWYVNGARGVEKIIQEPAPDDPFRTAMLDILSERDNNPVEWLRKMKSRR